MVLVLIIPSGVASKIFEHIDNQHSYGFISGISHGLMGPFLMIKDFPSFGIRAIYAAHNSGWTYQVSFVIGALISIALGVALIERVTLRTDQRGLD